MLTSDVRLKQILADRIHGSRTITQGIVDVLLEDLTDKPVPASEFTELARTITSHVPSFALVFDLLHTVGYAAFDKTDRVSASRFRDLVAAWLTEWDEARHTMAQRGRTLLAGIHSVATYSSSGAVLDLLKDAIGGGVRPRVIGSIAEPGREGELFLRGVKEMGLATEVVSDSELPQRAARCDLVLLGADAVFVDQFWNKTGSANLCHVASEAHVPVYLAAEVQKWVPTTWGLHIAASGGALFELVPIQDISALISFREAATLGAIGATIAAKRTCPYLISSPRKT